MAAPVLDLPNFEITDASYCGVGAVLLQLFHPIVFFQWKLCSRMQATTTYIRELYVITQVIHKWRQYLLGRNLLFKRIIEV